MSDNPYQAGGPLPVESKVYIFRDADLKLRNLLTRSGRSRHSKLLEPRQQGKTGLVQRLRSTLPRTTATAYVDLESLPAESPEAWYHEFGRRLFANLFPETPEPVGGLPTSENDFRSFLATLRARLPSDVHRLGIVLDEVGSIPPDWSERFFRLGREVGISQDFDWLGLVLVGCVDPQDLISNENVSPFNIAVDIRLFDLTLKQVTTLASSLPRLVENISLVAERLFYWTEGQPYITQWLCSDLLDTDSPIDCDAVDASVERFLHDDTNHLPGIIRKLRANGEATAFVDSIPNSRHKYMASVDRQQYYLARVLGVMKERNGYCHIRNRVYERALKAVPGLSPDSPPRDRLFVSYHNVRPDRKYVDDFETALKLHKVNVWIDRNKIKHGDFLPQIVKAIDESRAALLFVSQGYLASDFIAREEVGRLIDAAREKGLKLRWVMVEESAVEKTPISKFTCVNVRNPLRKMSPADRSSLWARLADEIAELMKD